MSHRPPKENKKKPQHTPKEKKAIKATKEALDRCRGLHQALRSAGRGSVRGAASKSARPPGIGRMSASALTAVASTRLRLRYALDW
jgi:hypothetical protein